MSDRTRSANGTFSRPSRAALTSTTSSSSHTNTNTNTNTNNTAASSSSSSRPNPFRSQLIRRPTASSTNSAETVRLDADGLSDSSSEIVVRDQHGEIEVENPPTPVVDDEDELAALEDRQEVEKERQRLAEAVKRHQSSHSSVSDPTEELLDAVRADLRAKVSALAEDNWMFEPEEPPRG